MRGAMVRRSRDGAPDVAADTNVSGAGPGQMMHVEEEVVRDLRHSVGNHFHKLYYWADRIGSDEGAADRTELGQELNGALERFQALLELGLRYFEADKASPMEMSAADVASASESVLRTELPAAEITVTVADAVVGKRLRLDPQRFSLALRLVAKLLGGEKREAFTCDFAACGDEAAVDITIEPIGGDAPLETPVIEWAIARKAIVMQGGSLRASAAQGDTMRGCVVRLPLGR